MTDAAAPRLVLLCGLPGSGKTTLARLLAEELPAVRLCPDEWMTDLDLDLYDERARARVETRFWELGQELLRLGQSVVLDFGFWSREERDEKRREAGELGVPVELHFLDVPLDELCRRVDKRQADGTWSAAPITREQLEQWSAHFQAPDQAELALYDTPATRRPGGPSVDR